MPVVRKPWLPGVPRPTRSPIKAATRSKYPMRQGRRAPDRPSAERPPMSSSRLSRCARGRAPGNGRLTACRRKVRKGGRRETRRLELRADGRRARRKRSRRLLFVSRREAPLGIVYATDAAADPRVRIARVFPKTLIRRSSIRRRSRLTARIRQQPDCSNFSTRRRRGRYSRSGVLAYLAERPELLAAPSALASGAQPRARA
jgi:hypothetical protein